MISRKTARIVMVISAWALLVALPALAQGPGRRRWARHYNPATEVRVKGTVQKVPQVGRYGGGPSTFIILKTEKENLEVHLGPTAFVTLSGFTFASRDHIEVIGSRVKFGDADVLLAREVQKEGQTLVLRDANGIPKWRRARRGV
jgi:hypothetical protein